MRSGREVVAARLSRKRRRNAGRPRVGTIRDNVGRSDMVGDSFTTREVVARRSPVRQVEPSGLDPRFPVPKNSGMSTVPETSDSSHRPKLRLTLSAERAEGGVVVFDPIRVGEPVQLTPLGF